VAAAVAMMCALPSAAGAQVRVVNTTADHAPDGCDDGPVGDCTLREAVIQDTATEIQLPDDTYPLESQLSIGRSLTLRGTQDDVLATLTRAGTSGPMRIIQVQPDVLVQLLKLRVVGGETNSFGGGIFVANAASLVVTDSEIVDNEAASGGGIWAAGTLTLVRTTVASNDALGDGEGNLGQGGGVGLAPGVPATMVNTTLSGNRTNGQGGGLYTQRSSVLQNVSIVGNEAPPRVAGILQGGGLLQAFPAGSGLRTTATNVLVARNVNGGCGGTAGEFFIDSDNGLIDEPLPNTTCNAVGDDNLIVPDAFVGALEFNGALTRTHALLGDSPAVDAGAACAPDDQRGVPRPFGPACDIGAFELDTIADVNVFTDDSNGACTPAHCTLRERVEAAVDGDVINLDAGTYELTAGEPLRFDENIEIVGRGARATTIDANRTSRIGFVTGPADVLIGGVTVTGGDADAGDNGSQGWGGAFYIDSTGELILAQTAVIDNVASVVGGAVANQGSFLFVESLAFSNRVQGNNPALGGAIWSIGQGASIFNSTISGNAAIPIGGSRTAGGGIYVADTSDFEHVTITGNSAEEGAGLYDASGDSAIFGTLIAGNQGPECGDASISTTVEHHNLSDDITCQFDAEGDRQGVDPLLAPLANYGGPTDTHALRAGSPAIDGQHALFCPPIDQRLFARPSGPCDIGAFEGSLAPPSPPSGGGGTQQPPPLPPDDTQELPPPVAGKNVNAEPAGGTVKVKVKGTRSFVELEEGQQIPVGSEIDTRNGRVTLEAAGGSRS
jgi:CSLREA domain-containing protein